MKAHYTTLEFVVVNESIPILLLTHKHLYSFSTFFFCSFFLQYETFIKRNLHLHLIAVRIKWQLSFRREYDGKNDDLTKAHNTFKSFNSSFANVPIRFCITTFILNGRKWAQISFEVVSESIEIRFSVGCYTANAWRNCWNQSINQNEVQWWTLGKCKINDSLEYH